MGDHQFSRSLRIISALVLSFFCWTFAGGVDVAYAVKSSSQPSAISKQQTATSPSHGEKFSKDIEDIDSVLKDASTDIDTKRLKLRGKKAEIDADDVEIRKQFSDTEAKIKDLPIEIQQRHRDFVQKYEDNLKTLRDDLDEIDKATTESEKELAIQKAQEFLDKVKPPKKKSHFDPNKLPHRSAEPVFKDPRTKPEEFQKESGQQLAVSSQPKPLLVASSGSLAGLLSKNTQYNTRTADSLPEGSFQIALSNPPTTADLAENIEIQFTPAITAKAAELNHNPAKIYNWVRNNIEYAPTYGSIQGADYCLQTKLCNDMDTASLLIALLRASGIHAHYVYGTIQLPIEKVKNWVGGFTDSMEALRLLASAGVPTKGLTVGGQVAYVQMEHVWVEAFIDYIPSRGARHKNGHGDMWVPLDASYKQYNYTQPLDIKSAVPFDTQSFINQIQSTATIDQTAGYVTNVNSAFIQQTMQDYQTQVQNYISQNYPNATVGDVLGKKDIVQQNFSYLLGTLPYKTIVKGATYGTLPSSLRHYLSFDVTKDIFDSEIGTPINITKSLPELAGKKITLSYSPATSADETVINSYLPQPHADGTPIQPSELPSSLPAYLISLKPELRIDGVVAATGTSVGMGNKETFTMTFSGPGTNYNDLITNDVTAGQYLGIGLDLGRISPDQMAALKTKLETTKTKLENQEFSGLTKDDVLGDLLYVTAVFYYGELDAKDFVTARTMGVASLRLPSENIFSLELKVATFFGSPLSASPGGLAMDVDRAITLVKALDADKVKPIQFLLTSGVDSSALEHIVPGQLWSTAENPVYGISAVKALQTANDQAIPIYTINQSNISIILPQIQLDSGTIMDIKNAVNAGKIVTVSKSDINFNGWTGNGYIIIDSSNGSAAYMVAGGMNGAFLALAGPCSPLLFVISYGFDVVSSIPHGIELGVEGYLLSNVELEIAKNYDATPEHCTHYDIKMIYEICIQAGNSEWANIARYGLKKDFLEAGYSAEWLGESHTKWFIYATLISFGIYDR